MRFLKNVNNSHNDVCNLYEIMELIEKEHKKYMRCE